jgi:3-deoxy-D-manno-octulosonate 8-phosphate phosphatase (KDO 8-P phosphatase)
VDVVKRRRPSAVDWARVRLFAMDVDGVLTDGTVRISSDGTESKRFSITDGLGLVLLRKSGVELAWISGRRSAATALRAAELKVAHVIEGRHDKLAALGELSKRLGVPLSACAYMGDDIVDAAAMAAAGIGISVPSALPQAIAAAGYVTRRPAGMGAVREVCDLILRARSKGSGNIRALLRTLH